MGEQIVLCRCAFVFGRRDGLAGHSALTGSSKITRMFADAGEKIGDPQSTFATLTKFPLRA